MSIKREQVADLQPGDVVELAASEPLSTVVRGRLHNFFSPPNSFGLSLGAGLPVRRVDGGVAQQWLDSDWTLTVISRAPRPLYVNHDRTEPVPGDVVRDADDAASVATWMCAMPHMMKRPWVTPGGNKLAPDEMPARLRLLVDGETGQVVP